MAPPHGARNVWIALLTALTPLLLCTAPASATPRTIYVDDDAPLGGNGAAWTTAYRFLQDALAVEGADIEIRVAQGTYYPDRSTAHPNGTADRQASFALRNGVALRGGYAGRGAPNPDARNIDAYLTTLSGEIGWLESEDNSLHILTGVNLDATVVLDGFQIAGANGIGMLNNHLGAGLYLEASSPLIIGCIFHHNIAGGLGGGGLGTRAGSPTLTNCTFTGNTAPGRSGSPGAGLAIINGSASLTNCSFLRNTAETKGAALFNCGGQLVLTHCAFTENMLTSQATFGGAAILNESGGLTLTDSTFTGNVTSLYSDWNRGGGALALHTESRATVTNCTFIGNVVTGFSGDGGGLYMSDLAHVSLENCSFVNNEASSRRGNGGALAAVLGNSLEITGCFFSANGAKLEGGGLLVKEAAAALTACTFRRNRAGTGGGLAMINSTVTTTDSTFAENAASIFSDEYPTGLGGGVSMRGSLANFHNCAFTGNIADTQENFTTNRGGGLYSSGSTLTLAECTFTANMVKAYDATGGAWFSEAEEPVLINCIFASNVVEGEYAYGGAIHNRSGAPVLTGCAFTRNAATGDFAGGGAVYNSDADSTFTNCAFLANTAAGSQESRGGAICVGDGHPTCINCTSTDNMARGSDAQGGGLYNASGNPTLANCIFWNDEPAEVATLGVGVTVTYTLIAGGHPGPGNINTNPLFIDPLGPDHQPGTGDEDLRLRPGSPCIDAADNAAVPPNITTDAAGRPRFTDEPATPDTGPGTPPIVNMGANEYQPGDCNDNGIPDAEDIAQGASRDCNNNAIPDECDPLYYSIPLFISQLLTPTPQPVLLCMYDTNANGTLDGTDIPAMITRLTTR